MKYIDADKLIAEIKRYKQESAIARFDNAGENADYFQGKVELCNDLTHIITSLQQEQPEVDLEKEIFEIEKKYGDIDEMGGYQILLFDDEFRDILRHFYELGLNARKEK